MNRISRNISVALRAERIIARRRFAIMRNQTAYMAMAGLVAGIGIIMLNAAAYLALSGQMSAPAAALIVALANLVLAALLATLASRMTAETDLAPVCEVRDMAIEDVEAEMEDLVKEATVLVGDIRKVAKDPLGTAGASLIGPILSMLIKAMTKSNK